jgi:hypothetical protein
MTVDACPTPEKNSKMTVVISCIAIFIVLLCISCGIIFMRIAGKNENISKQEWDGPSNAIISYYETGLTGHNPVLAYRLREITYSRKVGYKKFKSRISVVKEAHVIDLQNIGFTSGYDTLYSPQFRFHIALHILRADTVKDEYYQGTVVVGDLGNGRYAILDNSDLKTIENPNFSLACWAYRLSQKYHFFDNKGYAIPNSQQYYLPLAVNQIKNAKMGKIQFKGGEADDGQYQYSIQEPTYGDINKDSIEDMVVRIAVSMAQSNFIANELHAFLNVAGKPKWIGSINIDNQLIEAISISNGTIDVASKFHGSNDPYCCPTLLKKTSYAFNGKGFNENIYYTESLHPAVSENQNLYASQNPTMDQQQNESSGYSTSNTSGGSVDNRPSSYNGSTNPVSADNNSQPNESHSLYSDSKDFVKSTAAATKMGWEIMNGDPTDVANKLMNDENYRNKLEKSVDDYGQSSERMNEHLNQANQSIQDAAKSVGKMLGF